MTVTARDGEAETVRSRSVQCDRRQSVVDQCGEGLCGWAMQALGPQQTYKHEMDNDSSTTKDKNERHTSTHRHKETTALLRQTESLVSTCDTLSTVFSVVRYV